jgi:hypothetical protein
MFKDNQHIDQTRIPLAKDRFLRLLKHIENDVRYKRCVVHYHSFIKTCKCKILPFNSLESYVIIHKGNTNFKSSICFFFKMENTPCLRYDFQAHTYFCVCMRERMMVMIFEIENTPCLRYDFQAHTYLCV